MARQKATAANLDQIIKAELEKYGEDVKESLDEVLEDAAKRGKEAVKNDALSLFADVHLPRGRYGTGWAVDINKQRLKSVFTIHNKKYPSLTHLLENGHANRDGGRTQGRPHIGPVEQQLNETIEREVIRKINDI